MSRRGRNPLLRKGWGWHRNLARFGAILSLLLILALIVGNITSVLAIEPPPSFLLKWGTLGSGDGQFYHPSGRGC